MVRRATNSSSSSSLSSASSLPHSHRRDLSTDLSLGLSIPSSHHDSSREEPSDWPSVKPLRRSRMSENNNNDDSQNQPAFYVKVNMEGVQVGRKLDLLSQDGYDDLIRTLAHMFSTNILCPDIYQVYSEQDHVLTYEDKEGDWMMVGDVPWEMFLTTVKRLKITRADKC